MSVERRLSPSIRSEVARDAAVAPAASPATLPRAWWRLGLLGGLLVLVVAAFLLTLAVGSVHVPAAAVLRILTGQSVGDATWRTIVIDLRLPRALMAAGSGVALGLSGLQMQTVFRNPLADPFVLGVSAGASLGVALVVFTSAGQQRLFAAQGIWGNSSMVIGAALGAGLVLALMLVLSSATRDMGVVLIAGVMVGAFITALVTIFVFLADDRRSRAFIDWGFGSFQKTTWNELKVFLPAVLVGSASAATCIKPLNALLLGDAYARSMGVSVGRTRLLALGNASLLAGAVVAYAGPIAFLGIAAPHLARGLTGTSDHRTLMPAAMLTGAALALVCGIVAEAPGSAQTFPLNAATALIGAPVVLWVLLRLRRGNL